MKSVIIFLIGFILMLLALMMICSANWWTPVGVYLSYLLWKSTKTPKGSKFWKVWKNANNRLNNAIAPRRKDGAKTN